MGTVTEREKLIKTIREVALEQNINPVTIENLLETKLIPEDLLKEYINNNEQLAELILENEREQLKDILLSYEKEDNSLDILFKVSKEIAENFQKISPFLSNQIKALYPEIYEEHFSKKSDFIFERISGNIQRGIWNGFYRDDISTELVARRYISRLIDLYNTENFPLEELSFSTVFVEMFENFVKSIATEKGLDYWEKKKKQEGFNF